MDTDQDLATHAARLATFDRPQQTAKRRASSAKKKVQSTVSWPHQTPRPEDLARAGFYYKPTATSNDSVTCFLCDKALDGWEPNDDPAVEHLNHVPNCGWAINVCIEQRSQDMDRAEEDPQSDKMVEARRATFRDAWPHEGRKGWKCKMSKMVEAGWCHTPLPEADDCVHCFYCGVSLDGWEPKDDPWDEHRRRAPDCHFFTLVEESKKMKQSTKTARGRVSRASRTSRLSTQSNATLVSEAPSMVDTGYESAEEGDTIMTTVSTASKATRGKRKPAKKAAPKRTKKAQIQEESMMDNPVDPDVANEAVEEDRSIALTAKDDISSPPPKTRAKRAPKRVVSNSQEAESSVVESKPAAQPVSRTQRTRKQADPIRDSIDSQVETQLSTLSPQPPIEDVSRPARGKKRTSDGLEKLESSILSQGEAPKQKRKAVKKGRAAKKAMVEIAADTEDTLDEAARPEHETATSVVVVEQSQEKKPTKTSRTALASKVADVEQPTVSREQTTKPLSPMRAPVTKATAPPTPVSKPVERPQSISPQSSDAENIPPSSRPSLSTSRNASQAIRIFEATTPNQSPTKARHLPLMSSMNPWTSIDLETIFLPSPSSKNQIGKEKASLTNVLQRLTNLEREMSVEDWIVHHAEGAEKELRSECERLISTFEREGNRALQALEGIPAS